MSTLTLVRRKSAKNSSGMVQTLFDWDAPTQVIEPQLDEVSELRSLIASKAQQQTLDFGSAFSTHHRATESHRPAQTTPRKASFSKPTPRRGREEHVGVALVSVLGKYGISVDDLLHEIERQKKESAQSPACV